MTTNFINNEKLATALEAEIVQEFRKSFERAIQDEDLSMQSLYISDAGEALDVCYYIKQGNLNEARQRLSRMDTLPREDLYSLMERVAGSEIVDSMF